MTEDVFGGMKTQDEATAELLAALDELYPLPDDEKRCERAGRTAFVLKRWIQASEVDVARAAAVILKRKLLGRRDG